MRTVLAAWLLGMAVVSMGCGRDPAPPKVDAAAEAEDERLIKEAGAREQKARKAQGKNKAPES